MVTRAIIGLMLALSMNLVQGQDLSTSRFNEVDSRAIIQPSADVSAVSLTSPALATFLPAASDHTNWVFSGVVTNESGESYDYVFQMFHDEYKFHAIASLFDAQTKRLVFQNVSDAIQEDQNSYNWHVGNAFLRFNSINASWIFGVQDESKQGFNFKVDMLKQAQHEPNTQDLRHGVVLMVTQTGQLDGHIQLESRGEQFVTAKNAWFRQIWLTAPQEKSHQMSGVLCQFNDGSGFYAMNMLEADALRAAVAGWYDEQGLPGQISQFINVRQAKEGPWHIRVSSPNLHLILKDYVQQDAIIAGFVSTKDKSGFCLLSQDDIGHKTLIAHSEQDGTKTG